MKKLLLLLTTFTLTSGSFATLNNFSRETTHFTDATNESKAQQIADKIDHSVVKLDPNFWLNKNIDVYETQLNELLVKEGILTQAEASVAIIWQNFTIKKATAVPYKVSFTVICQWSTADGTTELNASTGESSYQIAQKIQIFPVIYLKLSYWHTHPLQNHIPELQKVLIKQKVLTSPEASVVTGVDILTPHPILGPTLQGIIVNDGVTTSEAIAEVDYI